MSEHTNILSRRAFIGTAAAVGAATMAAPNIAFGATAAEKQAEADAVRNQLISLQADLETASDNYYGALDEQQAAQDAMAAEQAKIDDTNAQIQDLQGKLSTRARSMYRTGSASFLDFVLGATSFDEFTSNWDLLTQMNNNDSEMVDTSKQLREQLQASKDEYARQEQIAADKAAEAAQIQQEVRARAGCSGSCCCSRSGGRSEPEQRFWRQLERWRVKQRRWLQQWRRLHWRQLRCPLLWFGCRLRHVAHRLPICVGCRRSERLRLLRTRALGIFASWHFPSASKRGALQLRIMARACF